MPWGSGYIIGAQDMNNSYLDYRYPDDSPCHMAARLLPHIYALCGNLGSSVRVLDVGCGNGFVAGRFLERGCQVVGIDLSQEGIAIARKTYPGARFEMLAADDNILTDLGEEAFDIIISTEVVEHLYSPRPYAAGCFGALRPGGRFICSTPYHGYLKNLALSIVNKWDRHLDPLWDGGHIKFWSPNSLYRLLNEAGFEDLQFAGVGRVPYLWMSMVVSGRRPR